MQGDENNGGGNAKKGRSSSSTSKKNDAGLARIRSANRRQEFSAPSDIYPVFLRKENYRPSAGVDDKFEPGDKDDAVQQNIYRSDLWITVPLDLLHKNASGFADMYDENQMAKAKNIQSVVYMLTAGRRMNELRPGSVSVYLELMVANDCGILRERQAEAVLGDANPLDKNVKLQLFNPSNVLGYRFRMVLHSNSSSATTIVHRQIFYNQEEVGLIDRKTRNAKMLLLVSDSDARKTRIREMAKERVYSGKELARDTEESDDIKAEIEAAAAKIERFLRNVKPISRSQRERLDTNIRTEDPRLYYRSVLTNRDYITLVRAQDRLAKLRMPTDPNYELTAAQLESESLAYHEINAVDPKRAWSWDQSRRIMQHNCSGIESCLAQNIHESYYMSDAEGNREILAFPFPHLVWRLNIDTEYDVATLFNTRFPWYLSMLSDRMFAISQTIQTHHERKERESLAASSSGSNAAASAADVVVAAAAATPMSLDVGVTNHSLEMRDNPTMSAARQSARMIQDAQLQDDAMKEDISARQTTVGRSRDQVLLAQSVEHGVVVPQYFSTMVSAEFDERHVNSSMQTVADSGLMIEPGEYSSGAHKYIEGDITKMARRHRRLLREIHDLVEQYPCEVPHVDKPVAMSEQEAFYERYELQRELQCLHSVEAIHEMIQLIGSNGSNCSEMHVNSLRVWCDTPTERFVELLPCDYPNMSMFANYRILSLKKYVSIGATNPLLYLGLYTNFKNVMSSSDTVRLSHNTAVIAQRGQGKSHMLAILAKGVPSGGIRPMDSKSKLSDAVGTAQGNHVRTVDEMLGAVGNQTHQGMEKYEEDRRMIKAALTQQQVSFSRNVRDEDTGKHKNESMTVQCLHGMIVVGNYWYISKGADTSLADRFNVEFLVNWCQRSATGLARRALPLNKLQTDHLTNKVTESALLNNAISCLLITMLDVGAIIQVDLTVFQVIMLKALDALSPWMPSCDDRIRMVQRAENEAWSETINFAQYTMLNSEVSPYARSGNAEEDRKKPLPLLENFPSIFAPALWCRWDIGLHAVTKFMQEFYSMRWCELLRIAAARLGSFYPQFYEPSYRSSNINVPDIEGRARQRMADPNASQVEYPEFLKRWQQFADARDSDVFFRWEATSAGRSGEICVPRMPKAQNGTGSQKAYAESTRSSIVDRSKYGANVRTVGGGGKESAKATTNLGEGKYLYNPNFIQINGSLREMCALLATCMSDVFQTDAEVLISLFEHMQTRTVLVPRYQTACHGDPSALDFVYTTQRTPKGVKRTVVYETVPLIQECAGDNAAGEGDRGRCVRIATGALMVPQAHLLFMMLTEAENKFTKPLSTVLPLEVPHHDSMMERFDVRPRLNVTLKVANVHYHGANTSSTKEKNDYTVNYEQMCAQPERRPCISSLFDEQISSSPMIEFQDHDIEEVVFYRHLRQTCMMPNLSWIAQVYNDVTRTINAAKPKDQQKDDKIPYPNPSKLTLEEKKQLWKLYPHRDMQFPGHADRMMRENQKQRNAVVFQQRMERNYPQLQLECALLDNIMQTAMRTAEERITDSLSLVEQAEFATYRDFLDCLRQGHHVEVFTLQELRERGKPGLDEMQAIGWAITPEVRFQINNCAPKESDAVLWLVNTKKPMSDAHRRLLDEIDSFDELLSSMMYMRVGNPGLSSNAIYARVLQCRGSKELRDIVARETAKITTAQTVVKEAEELAKATSMEVDLPVNNDDEERDVNNARALIQCFDRIQKATEVIRFLGYSDRVIYWTEQLHIRQTIDKHVALLTPVSNKRSQPSSSSSLGSNNNTSRPIAGAAAPFVVPTKKAAAAATTSGHVSAATVGSDEGEPMSVSANKRQTTTDTNPSAPDMQVQFDVPLQRVATAPRGTVRLNAMPSNR